MEGNRSHRMENGGRGEREVGRILGGRKRLRLNERKTGNTAIVCQTQQAETQQQEGERVKKDECICWKRKRAREGERERGKEEAKFEWRFFGWKVTGVISFFTQSIHAFSILYSLFSLSIHRGRQSIASIPLSISSVISYISPATMISLDS